MCNYEKRSNAQVDQNVMDEVLNETEKYAVNTKKNLSCNEAASTVNEVIQRISDKHSQILYLNFILKCIAEFKSIRASEKENVKLYIKFLYLLYVFAM